MTDLTCRQVKQDNVSGKALRRECIYEATGEGFLFVGTFSRGILQTRTAPGDVFVDVVSDRSSILLASTKERKQRLPDQYQTTSFLLPFFVFFRILILRSGSFLFSHRTSSVSQSSSLRLSGKSAYSAADLQRTVLPHGRYRRKYPDPLQVYQQ